MSLARPRIKPYISRITVADLTPDDEKWLDIALKTDYHGLSMGRCLSLIAQDTMQMWRMGRFEGIFVTEIVAWENGTSLVGLYLAGKGYIKNLDSIVETLKYFASNQGCRTIEFSTKLKGLQRIYEKKFTESSRTYSIGV